MELSWDVEERQIGQVDEDTGAFTPVIAWNFHIERWVYNSNFIFLTFIEGLFPVLMTSIMGFW